jgi:hypothetical protein
MDSETNSPDPTPSESKRDAILRKKIVRNLAESLVTCGGLLTLGNELERKGMPNRLQREMSVDEAEKALLEVIENHNLLPDGLKFGEVMSQPPNERGTWALSQVETQISNEDH